jgi:O-antigen/teichoic acid export membrane protein
VKAFKLLVKDSVVYGVAGAIQKLSPLILIPIITGYLGKTAFRLYDLCFIYAYLFSWLIILGQDAAASVFYFDETRERFNKKQVLAYSFWLQVLSLMFFLGCIYPFRQQAAGFIFPTDPQTAGYWLRALYVIPGHISFNYALNILLWKRKKKMYLVLCLFQAAVTIAGVLYFILLQHGNVDTLFYVLIASINISGLAALYLIRKDIFVSPFPMNRRLVKKLLLFGLPFALTAFFGQLIPSIDRYFLLRFGFIADMPQYSLAAKLGAFVNLATGAFVMAFTPYSLNKLNQHDAEKELSQLFRLVSTVALVAIPFVLLFKELMINIFANPSYALSARLLPFFFFGWVFDLFSYFSMMGMYKTQQSFIVLAMLAVSTLLITVLNITLVPSYGVFGAAISFCITKFFLFLLPLFYLRKHFKITIHKQSFFAALAIAFLCTWLVYVLKWYAAAVILLVVTGSFAIYIKKHLHLNR